MSIIRILPEDVSNRIAAGEVVERPASVVKELVENAIDADATQVAIHIQNGGRRLIKVIDNGHGMDPEDSLLCLEAHATSKIREATDIEQIASLGFRGEAIPSIASISKFSLQSRPAEQDFGTEVIVNGGVIREVNEVGCAQGTTITVRNIFYNIPARRKFLRSNQTEEHHIEQTLLVMALANPSVGFQLTFDNRPILSVQPGKDAVTRATMVLGRDTMGLMLPVDYQESDITVTGFIARPGLTRSTRREQRTFVNRRPVDAKGIYLAIRDAYHTMVMKGRYPPVVLFVELPPEDVDVNVHPAKKEVRFRNERLVGQVVGAALRRALRGVVEGAPANTDMPPPPPRSTPSLPTPVATAMPPAVARDDEAVQQGTLGIPSMPVIQFPDLSQSLPAEAPPPVAAPDVPLQPVEAPVSAPPPVDTPAAGTSVSAAEPDRIRELRVIGSLADEFILAEGPDGLVLIDQHAAHERVLFEKVLEEAEAQDGTGQGLLIPITLDLAAADAKTLREELSEFNRLGFELEHFGGNTFIVNAVPPHFPQENVSGVIHDILDELRDSPLGVRRADEGKIAQAACKAAVKAHDELSSDEITRLLAELMTADLPYTCPHGRPTMINLSFKELEKRFGRRQ